MGSQDLKSAFFTGDYSAFPISEAVSIVRQLTEGLEHVHAQGVLHLDVKPSNILYSGDVEAVLIDFSVAREFDHKKLPKDNAGTRDWMAPEQTSRSTVGPYTDVFGLGVVLYQLLAGGELPFSTVEKESSSTADDDGPRRMVKVPEYSVAPVHPSEVNALVSRELGDVTLRAIALAVEGGGRTGCWCLIGVLVGLAAKGEREVLK